VRDGGRCGAAGLIANETLAYFMARTQLWLARVGVCRERMRLRQHLRTEMAHYATDCWDMEIQVCVCACVRILCADVCGCVCVFLF
jgi:glycyl-tRNA synthetase